MTEHKFYITFYRSPQERASRLPDVIEHFALVASECGLPREATPEVFDEPMSTLPGAGTRYLGWRYLAEV